MSWQVPEMLLQSLVAVERPIARLALQRDSMSSRVPQMLLQSLVAAEISIARLALEHIGILGRLSSELP